MSDRKDFIAFVARELGYHHTSERRLEKEQITVVTCMCGRWQRSIAGPWREVWEVHVAEELDRRGALVDPQADRTVQIIEDLAKMGVTALTERLPDWFSSQDKTDREQGTTKAGHIDDSSVGPKVKMSDLANASGMDPVLGAYGGKVQAERSTDRPGYVWLSTTSPQLGMANGIQRVNATLHLDPVGAERLRDRLTYLTRTTEPGQEWR